MHGDIGDVAAGLARAAAAVSESFGSHRIQHAHLETHATIGWLEGDRLVLRSSTQTPFLTRAAVSSSSACRPARCASRPPGSAAGSAASRRC